MNGTGSIWYQLGLDNSQLQVDAARASNIIRGVGGTVETEGVKIDNIVRRLTSGVAAFGLSFSAAALVKQIASVRGEFQQLEIAFETMLGSKGRANTLMSQLVDTAAKTPFDLTGVANGAKQLLAYGTAADEVNDTLVRLGNIASGLSIPLNDLVYLYGTTQVQGRLFTQDVRQFMGRGIPLIQELSNELGKTQDEINDMVSAGKIGFPEVEKVINRLTNEGGMFFNLMEKQSASITGQIANMQDAWDMMLNDLGSKSEGIFSDSIGLATSLIENYEKVGKILLGIVAIYGTYKAAVIAVNIVMKEQAAINAMVAASNGVLNKSLAVQWLWTGRVQKAQALLQKTMLTNPYVLATVAVVALGVAIWSLHDATTTQEKAQERLNEINEKATERKQSLENETQKLIGTINSETKTIYDQIVAYKELQGLYPDLFKNMDIQAFKAMSTAEQQKLLNKALNDLDSKNLDAEIAKQEKVVQNIVEGFKTIRDSGAASGQQKQLEIQTQVLDNLKKQRQEQLDMRKEADFLALDEEKRKIMLENQLSALEKQKEYIEEQISSIGGVYNEWNRFNPLFTSLNSQLESILGKIKETKDKLSANQENQNKSYWEKQKKEAEEALASMDISKKGSQDWNKQLQLRNQAQSKLKAWDFSDKGSKKDSSAQRKLEAQEWLFNRQKELSNEQIRFALDAEQSLLDIDKDSFKKQQKQNELNYRRSLQSIKEFEEQKRKDQIAYAKTLFTEENNGDTEGQKFDFNNYASKMPEGLRPEDIKKQVETLTDAAQQAWENADLIAYKSEQENIAELLSKYQDYNAKKIAINKQFQEDLKRLESLPVSNERNAAIEELKKSHIFTLATLDDEYAKTANSIQKIFGDMSRKSVAEMHKITDEAQRMIDFIQGGEWDADTGKSFGITEEQFKALNIEWSEAPEKLRAIIDAIADLTDHANKSDTAFKKMSAGLKKVFNSKDDTDKLRQGLEEIADGLSSVTELGGMFADTLRNIGGEDSSLGKVADGMSQVMDVANSTMQGAQAGAAFGPWGAAIGAAIGLASSLADAFSKAHDKKKEKEIQRLQEQVEVLEKSYDKLGRAIEKAYSQDAVKLIKQQDDALRKQKILIQQQINEERGKKKVDKGRIKEWEEQIEQIDLQLEENKERAVDAIFGQDIKSAIDDFASAYVEAWAAGENKASAMKDVVKKMIKGVVVEMLKSDLAPTIAKIRDKIQRYLTDGIIDATEQAELDRIIEQATQNADKKYSWADKYLAGDIVRGATARGVTTASQDSVDEMNGRFGVIQSHTFELNENVKILRTNSSAVLRHLSKIESNTADTNKRLGSIETEMSAVKDGIEAINLHGIILKK